VTATVDNVSLIAASIMSKKIASGADAIVLDVKVGDGAFMKTIEDARELGRVMIELGRHAGRETICVLTDMDQPLGRAVGNALEVREAAETVQGRGPDDFTELVLDSVSHLLALSDLGVDEQEGRRRAEEAVATGAALEAFERWIRAQHGDPDLEVLPRAPVVRDVTAPRAGVVASLGAIQIGMAALHLGAGRRTKEDAIDHAVGVVCLKKRGDAVGEGEPLAQVHAGNAKAAGEAVAEVLTAYELADTAPPASQIVLEVLT
jgi:pyrimidine-nucleoside phosphorylase